MNKLILHIGMHKTGSTAIQEAINGYSDHSMRYANFNSSNHSLSILPIFCKNPYALHLFKSCGMVKEEVDNYILSKKNELIKNLLLDDRDVIISGEDLCLLDFDEINSFNNFMKVNNRLVIVYSYIRHPYDFVSSYLSEVVKNGESSSCIEKFYYGSVFEKFVKIYNNDFHVKIYQRDLFLNKCVVSDFTDWIGLDFKMDSNILDLNPSLSELSLKLIYHLNSYINTLINESSLIARHSFIEYLRKKFPGKLILTKAQAEFFFDKGDIFYVQNLLGIQMDIEEFSNTPKSNFSLSQWAADLRDDELSNIMPTDIYDVVDLEYLPTNKIESIVISLYWYFWIKEHPEFSHFQAHKYLLHNPDIRSSGLNPYVHFITNGSSEVNRTFF